MILMYFLKLCVSVNENLKVKFANIFIIISEVIFSF